MAAGEHGARDAPRQCCICGATFTPPKYNQKSCSAVCRAELTLKTARDRQRTIRATVPRVEYEPGPCDRCGKQFVPKSNSARYCSGICLRRSTSAQYKKRKAEENRRKLDSQSRRCGACGAAFTPRTYQQAYCSRDCKAVAKLAQQAIRYQPKRERYGVRACVECGEQFRPRDDRQTCCTVACGGKLAHRIHARVRRARLAGVTVEKVDPLNVFERDGWRCQLCGRRTRKDLLRAGKYWHPRAPQLDHIIPIAKGGEHSYRNTQCACASCNRAKSDGPGGQLRLIA